MSDLPRIAHWQDASAAMDGIGASLKRICIKAGHVAARHSHAFEQFVVVISGGGALECEAGPVELKPGTVIHFPPGAWHSADFPEATVLLEVNLAEREI